MSTALKIIPTSETLGAEITDVDLTRSLNREQIEQIRAALLDLCIELLFRLDDVLQHPCSDVAVPRFL